MLGKLWYRLGDGVESLWKRVVREKYYGGRREVDITSVERFKVSKIWRDIIRIGGLSRNLRNMLVEGFKWEVGKGNKVGFWSERWMGVKSLRDLFPRLFALSVKKEGKVSEMGYWEERKWSWRLEWRRGTLGREKDEEEMLEKMLEGVNLKEGAGDVWKWVHGLDGKYGVKLAYDFLASSETVLENQLCKLIGCRLVPSKVAFFGWRLCLDRLPTKENLQKRGILLHEGVLSWWGLKSVLPNTVGGMAEFFIGSLGSIIGKEMGSCIFLVVAWYLWYRRNAQVFRKDEGLPENLLERMQVKTFIWIKSKVKGCVFSFYEWQSCPMECALAVKNHKRLRKQFYKDRVPSSGKRVLWEELGKLITSKRGNWILGEDFNAARTVGDRARCSGITREMREFDSFIHVTGLVDLPLAGRKYTWHSANGQHRSRIDRFLVSKECLQKWNDFKQWGLGRSVSDHCPLLLKNEKIDWGPKPFKFFDAWLEHPDCKEKWSANHTAEVDRRISEAERIIAEMDEKEEHSQLSEVDIEKRRNGFLDLWKNMKIQESMWQQKSRKMWLKEGDANSKFFHRSVKGRWRRNEINSIQIMGDQCRGVNEIKEGVMNYFKGLFSEEEWQRPKLDGISFKQIDKADNDFFMATFSEEDIKNTVWDCDSTKSLGPDGFNFRFIKEMWEEIKQDVIGFVQEFHEHGKLVRGSNSSFIALILKVENPYRIKDYRPISLIGVMYKILAKLLANRLRKVLDKIIGEHLPVYLMSAYKIPKGILFTLDKIHKNFLWGGMGERKKIGWVKWERVCRKKECGGLGVKDLRKFNMALLGKWWGRLAKGEDGLWSKVMSSKYGENGGHWLDWDGFTEGFRIKVGEGKRVSFWWDEWCGESYLANKFPRLYILCTGKDEECFQMGRALNGTWRWNLTWRRTLHQWEDETAKELQNMIEKVRISPGSADNWEWIHSPDGEYSTATAYALLTNQRREEEEAEIYKRIWNPNIPSKVAAFNWKVLLDRIPTKLNLLKRGVIKEEEERKCVLCEEEKEDSSHLFLNCKIVKWLWRACANWWGIEVGLQNECKKTFQLFGAWTKKSHKREGWDCIWNAVIWIVWMARNRKIFDNVECEVGGV
ncbi:hypothetical protein SLEP1_g23006 [Rubroshorea leprosula]|uniref:Reverse transcriptase zinc-binding domain-containing protein n=1 Tax=Rubroshorea leprosula TaxID=152421 RepID=A0AAV5JLE6_9ROSI|nr:hypothetical protein SLEP1_g23006 [Rubroshorea leprosula]